MEYSFFPSCEITYRDVISKNTNGESKLGSLADLESALIGSLYSVQENYIKIGIILKEIQDKYLFYYCYFDDNGTSRQFNTVYEYAAIKFNLKKTFCYNAIKIARFFLEKNGDICAGLKGYSYSALCEFVPLYNKFYNDQVDNYLPAWVKEEINPGMSVDAIRQVKKKYRNTTSNDQKKVKALVEAPDEEFFEEVCTEPDFTGGHYHVIKNDKERHLILDNYFAWEKFSENKFLDIEYYRFFCGEEGMYIIALSYASSMVKGMRNPHFYMKYPNSGCDFWEVSRSTLITFMKKHKVDCPKYIWDRIVEKKVR